MTSLFTPIKGARAIISRRGVYTAVPLYAYDERIYASLKGGFVQLKAGNQTSAQDIRWKAVHGAGYTEEWDGLRIVNKPGRVAARKLPEPNWEALQ